MIQLRDYQNECIRGVRNAYRAGKRAPLLVSPTGSGKTVMFAHIADRASTQLRRVVILVHRQELVDQTSKTLRAFGVDHGIISAGRTPDRRQLVQVASVQTLVRRLEVCKPDLIVIDEAHHGTAGSWRKVIDANPQARILGVTATPERLDGRGLGEVFDELIRGPEVAWLIEQGFLSKPHYYAPPQAVDLSHLRVARGDFDQREMAKTMDDKCITGDAVQHYAKLCRNEPAIAFCASIAHAEHVAEEFRASGFRAATIDGNMDRDERREVVKMLGDGRLHVLTSCEIINEGFDLPVVSAAILLRPTMSLGLHLQQVGRVLRPAPGKTRAIILDHVGNLARHGLAEEEREWSLGGRKRKSRKKDEQQEEVQVRQCLQCFACHAPAPRCPMCGYVYPPRERQLEIVDGELMQVDVEAMRRERMREQAKAQSLDDLIAIGRARGMNHPRAWAMHVLRAREERKQTTLQPRP